MNATITLEAIVCNDVITIHHTKAGVSVVNLLADYKNSKSGNVARLSLRGWGPLALALTGKNKDGNPRITRGTRLNLKLSMDSEKKTNKNTQQTYTQLVFDIVEFKVVDSVETS